MITDLEKAQLMFKLARSKGNWGAHCSVYPKLRSVGVKYDRLEHFKRFPNLNAVVKELAGNGWILIKEKSNYTGISLNSKYKKEIIEFIGRELPYVKEFLI